MNTLKAVQSKVHEQPGLKRLGTLLLVPLGLLGLVAVPMWSEPDGSKRSLLAWLVAAYRQDVLPALFAIRGLWLALASAKGWRPSASTQKPSLALGLTGFILLFAASAWFQWPEVGYLSILCAGAVISSNRAEARNCLDLSAPLPWLIMATPGLLQPLSSMLRLATAASVVGTLNVLGIAVEREGTLIAAYGQPGWQFVVADECSGVRTITTLLFISMLTAGGISGRTARLLLLLGAFPIGLAMNILRTTTIGAICGWRGEAAGMTFHKSLLAGAGPLAVGTILILLLARWLKRRQGLQPAAVQAS